MADNHDAEHHHPPYKLIFWVLCFFTAISWIADEFSHKIPGGATLAVIVLAVAVCKASCVMLYFMHLKFEKNWKYVILGPTTILAIGLPLALLPDVGVHYYEPDVPQNSVMMRRAAAAEAAQHDPGHTEDAHGGDHH